MKPRLAAQRLVASLVLAATTLPVLAAIGRDEAAAVAQRETGGRVLAVERADAGGRAMWRVKVVTPRGDVRQLMVDAATGRVQ